MKFSSQSPGYAKFEDIVQRDVAPVGETIVLAVGAMTMDFVEMCGRATMLERGSTHAIASTPSSLPMVALLRFGQWMAGCILMIIVCPFVRPPTEDTRLVTTTKSKPSRYWELHSALRLNGRVYNCE